MYKRQADDRELHPSIIALQDIGPSQVDDLGDAEAAGIGDPEEHVIAFRWRRSEQHRNIDFADNALGKRSATAGGIVFDFDRSAGVERRIAELVRIAEQ